jgi:hypothetical protein
VEDLAELTVGWLLGDLRSQPGYYGPVDVDEQDAPGLTQALVACNRAGWLTRNSQAGVVETAKGGVRWEQLAWVAGYARRPVAQRVYWTALSRPGLLPTIWSEGACGVCVTRLGGQPVTTDCWYGPDETRWDLDGAGAAAVDDVLDNCVQLSVVDLDVGGNTLWPWLTDTMPALAD